MKFRCYPAMTGKVARAPLRCLDKSATEHAVTIVDHQRLSRRDRAHRRVQRELDFVTLDPHDLRGDDWRAVPHAHADVIANRRCGIHEPVHAACNHSRAP